MKQMKHVVTLAVTAAAAALFTACSEEDIATTEATPTPITVVATIEDTGWGTRATATAFESKDSIGINSSYRQNVMYRYNGSSWESASPLYFNEMRESFTAYYPYNEGDLTEPEDYLFSSVSSASMFQAVAFKFRHVMSKLTFSVVDSATKAASTDITSVTVTGLVKSGEFDKTTGETKTGNLKASINSRSNSVIVFPQEATGEVTVKLVYKKVTYRATLSATAYEAGVEYQYNITFNQ